MQRETQDPTVDERGDERHPAWALIGASRLSTMGPHGGAVLFDSDIRHGNTVRIQVYEAVRSRSLHRDRVHTDSRLPIVEVEMSEAQWASFVSSMNVGDGVPCTVRARRALGKYEQMPEMPYAPRLQESMDEVRNAAAQAQAEVAEAFEAYKAHKTVGNLRTLEARIRNLPANIRFAAESLTEHAENVVQRARADIEAMVVSKAQQLGLEPGDLGLEPAQLMAPDEPGEQ